MRWLLALLFVGCAHGVPLAYVSSRATLASWSFVVDDGGRGAELLIDGRTRLSGCDRAGTRIRCELRGLWPGGHTVELRLAGSVLRRSVRIGSGWPAHPKLVPAGDAAAIAEAAAAHADAVVLSPGPGLAGEVEAAHAHGLYALVTGDASAVAAFGADGVVGAPLAPAIRARFPEARSFVSR